MKLPKWRGWEDTERRIAFPIHMQASDTLTLNDGRRFQVLSPVTIQSESAVAAAVAAGWLAPVAVHGS
jgi:hypothetical protein